MDANVNQQSFAPDPVKADFVILFRAPTRDAPKTSEQLEKLIRYLDRVGLEVECRHGGKGTVLIFVRCHQEKVKTEVYKSRYLRMGRRESLIEGLRNGFMESGLLLRMNRRDLRWMRKLFLMRNG